MQPLVSAVVPTYNRAHYIAETLDSILAQTYRPIEIVVVDDGSTDDTEAVLEPYRDKARCIRQPNQGLAAARNTGLLASTGEYVAWLDSDDIWNPEKIALQVAFLEQHRDHALIGTQFSAFDENGFFDPTHASSYYSAIAKAAGGAAGLFSEKTQLSTRGDPALAGRLPETVPVYHGEIYARLVMGNFLHPPTVMFRRDAATRAGLLDREFGTGTDWEYLLRLSREGKAAYIDHPLMRYRYSPEQMSSDKHLADQALSRLLILERLKARDPELRRSVDFRRRLGFAHLVAAELLAEERPLPAARHLLRSLAMGQLERGTLRALAKMVLPRSLIAAYRARGRS